MLSEGAQIRLHLAGTHHDEMKNNVLPIQPSGGAQQIVGAFSPLEFGGVEHDRTVVMDAEPGTQLFTLTIREPHPGHEAVVVDRIGHIEDSPLGYADRPI